MKIIQAIKLTETIETVQVCMNIRCDENLSLVQIFLIVNKMIRIIIIICNLHYDYFYNDYNDRYL